MEHNPKVLLGRRVRELRRAKDITQEKLAELSHVDRTYINSCERGKRNVSIMLIAKLCRGLEISMMEFFNSPYFENVFEED